MIEFLIIISFYNNHDQQVFFNFLIFLKIFDLSWWWPIWILKMVEAIIANKSNDLNFPKIWDSMTSNGFNLIHLYKVKIS